MRLLPYAAGLHLKMVAMRLGQTSPSMAVFTLVNVGKKYFVVAQHGLFSFCLN